MKPVSVTDRASSEALFQNSIYQNNHLGWMPLWDIPRENGLICLDTTRKRNFLIALQPSEGSVFWLHSFYADKAPGDYPLAQKIKEILPPGRHSLYTISSHSWFNRLLEKNGFRKCDEIVEMETTVIHLSRSGYLVGSSALSHNLDETALSQCETVFPPLWRMTPAEIKIAISASSYKLVLMEKNTLIGALLADFAEENCHIQRISVLPEHQNKGAASTLIRQMVQDAQKAGMKSFSVNTNLNNRNAVRYYEKINFSIAGKRYPVYYRYI